MAFRAQGRPAALRTAVFFGLLGATFGVAWAVMIQMPGRSSYPFPLGAFYPSRGDFIGPSAT